MEVEFIPMYNGRPWEEVKLEYEKSRVLSLEEVMLLARMKYAAFLKSKGVEENSIFGSDYRKIELDTYLFQLQRNIVSDAWEAVYRRGTLIL